MSLNLAMMLRESARAKPEKAALILDNFRVTYAQLEALSNQVAGNLRAAGVQVGDRVGLMLPNVPQFVAAYYGILKAGAVVVPMNVLLKAPEVAYYLGDSGARALIVWEDFAEEARKGSPDGVLPYVVQKPGSSVLPDGARALC